MNYRPTHQPTPMRPSTVRWARFVLLAAMVVLTSAAPALAQSLTYVTPRGNDANDCQTPTTPCKTVSAAIEKAVALGSPTEVRIAMGTYREFVAIQTNSVLEITLSGNWNTAFTTQSARTVTFLRPNTRQSGRVILLNPGGGGGHLIATLTNLTITGGNQNLGDGNLPGAGMVIAATSGGVGTVTLDHVTVTANRFNDGPWGGGGLGTFVIDSGSIDLTVRDSVFSRNSSRTVGGAITITGGTTFRAERVMLQSNTAAIDGGALALLTEGASMDATLSNCFVSGNLARQSGGGVTTRVLGGDTLALTVENCSFAGNTAGTDRGGALRIGSVDGTLSLAVRNTIAWRNTAKVGADDISLGANVTAGNCSIAFSNMGEVDGTCGDGGGNVALDPMFVAPRGPNLHLKAGSPLRGLGNCALGPSDDIDGQARPQGAGCDIGADEIP